MALVVTFPYFVHILLATNIQRDKQAERGGDRPRNIIQSGKDNWGQTVDSYE